jgi:hypothetical protein
MNVLPEALEALASRVDALEKRVHELEHPSEALAAPAAQRFDAPAIAQVAEGAGIDQAGSMFPVLGRAMLGIAGAYVLRAVAESSPGSRQAIAAVAIAYAVAWLVWAAKAKAAALFTRVTYAGTSALILAPMLWELTLRFKVLAPPLTAAVLGAFVLTSAALAWRRDLAAVFWVAHGAAAATALALSIATQQMIPFLAALLLMVVLCEFAVARGRGQAVRPLVAALADAAVWALIFIYANPQSTRTDYPLLGTAALLAPACLLFLIHGVSVALKTTLLQRKITAFEVVQCMITFLLAATSLLLFAPDIGPHFVGVACLTLAAACYAAAFVLFRQAAEPRNFRVFAAWSALLLLAGTLSTLPLAWAAACLGLAALAAVVLGVRQECMTLDFHGVVYLAAAAGASGLLVYALRALAGPPSPKPAWSIFLVAACAVLCYAAGKERVGEAWQHQLLHLVPALLAVCAVAAMMAQGLLRLASLAIAPDVSHIAFIRTFAVCSVALALAFGGARWRRLEMTRIAYAALAFEAAKLIFEDLRYARMGFIAASFFLFAVTLIGVPRLTRMGQKT